MAWDHPQAKRGDASLDALARETRTRPASHADTERTLRAGLPPIMLADVIADMTSAEAVEGRKTTAQKRPPLWDPTPPDVRSAPLSTCLHAPSRRARWR
jgi:hypothetical protein